MTFKIPLFCSSDSAQVYNVGSASSSYLVLPMATDEITDYLNIPISLCHSLHVHGLVAPCAYFHNTYIYKKFYILKGCLRHV